MSLDFSAISNQERSESRLTGGGDADDDDFDDDDYYYDNSSFQYPVEVAERVRLANQMLAEDASPLESDRTRRVRFNDSLVEVQLSSPEYSEFESDDDDGFVDLRKGTKCVKDDSGSMHAQKGNENLDKLKDANACLRWAVPNDDKEETGSDSSTSSGVVVAESPDLIVEKDLEVQTSVQAFSKQSNTNKKVKSVFSLSSSTTQFLKYPPLETVYRSDESAEEGIYKSSASSSKPEPLKDNIILFEEVEELIEAIALEEETQQDQETDNVLTPKDGRKIKAKSSGVTKDKISKKTPNKIQKSGRTKKRDKEVIQFFAKRSFDSDEISHSESESEELRLNKEGSFSKKQKEKSSLLTSKMSETNISKHFRSGSIGSSKSSGSTSSLYKETQARPESAPDCRSLTYSWSAPNLSSEKQYPPRPYSSDSVLTVRKCVGGRWTTVRLPDYKGHRSVYGMSEEELNERQRKSRIQAEKQQQKREEEKAEEERKRAVREAVFKQWLRQKSYSKKSSAESEDNKALGDMEERKRVAKKAFDSWLQNKREKTKKQQQSELEKHGQSAEDTLGYTTEQCHDAYKQWLRKKNAQARALERKTKSKHNRSQSLERAIRMSPSFRHTYRVYTGAYI